MSSNALGHLSSSIVNFVQSAYPLNSYYAGNEHNIAVYPNAALSYYEYNDISNPALLKGCFVYNKSKADGNGAEIDLGDLPSGVYTVGVLTDSGITVRKIIRR